jgi:sigma-E factor negative regulatory protein RseC
MTEKGIITAKKGKVYVVRVSKTSACDGCKACAFGKNDYVDFKANSDIECGIGDSVVVETPAVKPYLTILLFFVLPVVLVLGAALIASAFGLSELHIALISLGLVVAVFSALFVVYRVFLRSKYLAQIKSITEK